MSKVLLIIQREFLTRVRKKSFLLMALLGPVLFCLGLIVPLWVGTISQETKVIEVIDDSNLFKNKLTESADLKFEYVNGTPDSRMIDFLQSNHFALLYIPDLNVKDPQGIILYSKTRPSPVLKFYLEKIVSQSLTMEKVKQAGISDTLLRDIETNISISSKNVFDKWENEGGATASVITALFLSVLIMFFIVLYGGQVMRGVIEEKTNRIIEVMVSSVKPFQLMMGKIIGIALVSLCQFLIWIVLSSSIALFINSRYEKVFDMYSNEKIETTLKNNPQLDVKSATEINDIMNAIRSVDFAYSLFVFLFYFVGGYLLYSALFAAIGASVDLETDTQQFVFPLLAPLMFCMVMATNIMQNSDSTLAFWLSMIPFTSPVAMMLRLPFGVSNIELISSMTILIITFILFTWLAGKIYRVGILMYGKKVSLPEIVKWVFYK